MKVKVLFYSLYERFWHWLQAAAVIVLLVTGFEISYASYFSVSGFKTAVNLHNLAGLILLVNAFLALFYNLASGLIQRYFPDMNDIFTLGFKHARYYMLGIFKGQNHPFDKTPEKRLLPLQKITYFVVLNFLLPVMIVSGGLKYSAEFYPELIEAFGGLSILGPIHRFGGWLFAAFLFLHIYMITTGHSLFSNLISMVTGYDTVDEPGKEETSL